MRSQRRFLNKRGKLPPWSVDSSLREGVVPSAQHQKSPELGAVPRLAAPVQGEAEELERDQQMLLAGLGPGGYKKGGLGSTSISSRLQG